jgi:hypothetical protein
LGVLLVHCVGPLLYKDLSGRNDFVDHVVHIVNSNVNA